MGKIDEIIKELKSDNKRQSDINLEVYANALLAYWEASKNIEENGIICLHPRTGTPVENPYLKIQKSQGDVITKSNIRSDRVVALIKSGQL